MSAAVVRPGDARRDDAGPDGLGDAAAHQADHAGNACGDVHEERGGEHHGPGHRLEDCRLPHQAREPDADSADAEEEHPQARNRHRGDADGLSAELHGYRDADTGVPHVRRLGGGVSPTGALGAGVELCRQFDDRDSLHTEGGGQHRLCKVREAELLGVGGHHAPSSRRGCAADVARRVQAPRVPHARRGREGVPDCHRQLPLRPMAHDCAGDWRPV